MKEVRKEEQQGLYRREFEHDNCGIGAVVNIKGKKTHETVANALRIVEHLEHRAGKDAEGETGDGVGILLQISHKFFKKVCKKVGQKRNGFNGSHDVVTKEENKNWIKQEISESKSCGRFQCVWSCFFTF